MSKKSQSLVVTHFTALLFRKPIGNIKDQSVEDHTIVSTLDRSIWSDLLRIYSGDIDNHNSQTSAFRFYASRKGTYDQWWAVVDVAGR